MIEINCFSCHKKMSFNDQIGRRDECPQCSADVHVCKNCRFYDVGSYNECRESSADVVRDKERSNFCDYFQPGSGGEVGEKKEDLLAAAEALFKK